MLSMQENMGFLRHNIYKCSQKKTIANLNRIEGSIG